MPDDRFITVSAPRAPGTLFPDIQDHIHNLWRYVTQPLNTIGGSGGHYTATIPVGVFPLQFGMKFGFIANHSATAIDIALDDNGTPHAAIAIVDRGGGSRSFTSGAYYEIWYDGSDFRAVAGL